MKSIPVTPQLYSSFFIYLLLWIRAEHNHWIQKESRQWHHSIMRRSSE